MPPPSATFAAIARALSGSIEAIGAVFDGDARDDGDAATSAIDPEPILRWTTDRFRALEPVGGARRFRRALSLYYRFAQANVVFDDSRLRAEGAPRAPSFDTWIDRCVRSTRDRALDALAIDDPLPGRTTAWKSIVRAGPSAALAAVATIRSRAPGKSDATASGVPASMSDFPLQAPECDQSYAPRPAA